MALRRQCLPLENLGPTEDRTQRRPKFMRDRREELVLQMARRLGLLALRLCAHRCDDQMRVGFAHPGKAAGQLSFDARRAYALSVARDVATAATVKRVCRTGADLAERRRAPSRDF